jgi:D-alanyl-D-alanine carboxypeptidase
LRRPDERLPATFASQRRRCTDAPRQSIPAAGPPQVTLLAKMAAEAPFVDSLAVAGESGTLRTVAAGTVAQGRCAGKTGTLAAVANTVGYCRARDGHTLAFAFMVQGNPATDYLHQVVEARVMEALAGYDG